MSSRKLEELNLLRQIETIHRESKKTYGSPRVQKQLLAQGSRCSKSRVERIMRKFGIRAKNPRKFRSTTDSKHSFPVAENLLNREFSVKKENKVWVADITAIWTDEGWLFLATVMDLFSRKLVGWQMSRWITRDLAMDALKMAFRRRRPQAGLMHHSDRGCQYASGDYQRLLESYGMICSMSRKGNCWDNAPMESFFHTLKGEHVYWERYSTRIQAQRSIATWIETTYNRKRLHSGIDYMSPDAYERAHAA